MPPGVQDLTPADFPGYAAAVARENLVRAAACLGLPESICGLEVMSMNIEHVRLLAMVRSPFLMRGIGAQRLCGKPGIETDVLTALWVLSPRWRPSGRARDRFLKSKPVRAIMRLPIDKPVAALLNYVDEAYIDSPAGGDDLKSYFAFEIPVAIEMSRAFGLPLDFWNKHPVRNFIRWVTGKPSPLRVPLKILFQIRKAQRQMDDPKAIMHNASDKLLADGLAAMNQRDKRTMDYEREMMRERPTCHPRFEPFEL